MIKNKILKEEKDRKKVIYIRDKRKPKENLITTNQIWTKEQKDQLRKEARKGRNEMRKNTKQEDEWLLNRLDEMFPDD